MLLNRKDECNRNIRDLGVLPEEAFQKYTGEKMDKVGCVFFLFSLLMLTVALSLSRGYTASTKA